MIYSVTDLGSDILVVEKLIEPSLCAHLIQVANCCDFRSPPPGSSLMGELRSNEVLPLAQGSFLLESTSALLLGSLTTLRELLAKRYQVTFAHAEIYAIERFRPGQNHKRHSDGLVLANRYQELAQGIAARDVSIVGFLNDDFAGGELLFDRQSIKVKATTGSLVIFPACYTHPYQALPVLQGCKYSFVAWLMR